MAAIYFTLPNFLCLGVDKHLCHTWRIYRWTNMPPTWGISLCLSWVDDYYWDFLADHYHTFLYILTWRVHRASMTGWFDTVKLIVGCPTSVARWFSSYGYPVCRALGISMDFGISGFGGSSGNVRDVRRTNASKVKFMWEWDTTGVRLSRGTENGW